MQEINKRNARIWSMLGMRRVVGVMLKNLAGLDDKFIFATADVARYFGTGDFQDTFPDRFIDVGIAEQNLVGVSAGMQKEGMHVFAATYATFITARVLDQIRVNLGYMKLGVKLIGVGGGLVEGDLSATHMGLEDISNIRTIPGIAIISPADCVELVKALYELLDYEGPAYLRLSGGTNIPVVYTQDYDFKIGRAICLKEGKDIALIATGTIVATVQKVAKSLEKRGISCKVINMHTIKPLDTKLLDSLDKYLLVVSIEEHMLSGGLGSAIAEYYTGKQKRPVHMMLGVSDFYPNAADYMQLLEICGLTEEHIIRKIEKRYYEIRNQIS